MIQSHQLQIGMVLVATLSFFALDDVNCSGSESNLLDCLPHHNCGMDRGAENAGVQCLRRGLDEQFLSFPAYIYKFIIRCRTRVWIQPRK